MIHAGRYQARRLSRAPSRRRRGGAVGAADVVLSLADAARRVAALLAKGPLAGSLAAVRAEAHWGDSQKELDVLANRLMVDALANAPVAIIGSEEMDEPFVATADAPLAVAIDPLDGSDNIETGAPVGTIFSVLPRVGDADPAASLLQRGSAQIAAGYFMYGSRTMLALTFGQGTQVFTLNPQSGDFILTTASVAIPPRTREYTINGSNQRHWDEAIRLYVSDCQKGASGPRGADFNTRWNASLVAETTRIMLRGGIYLYPGDARPGYRQGRLRLVYEANPIAFLTEQAGGGASDGRTRILDLAPTALHQRMPFVFGSREEVEGVARYYAVPLDTGETSPLFGRRSLFRV